MAYSGDQFLFSETPFSNGIGTNESITFTDDYLLWPDFPAELEEDVDVGSQPVTQTFYEGHSKCECCINWVEKRPTVIPDEEKAKYDRSAICLYKRKDHISDTARIGGLIEVRDFKVTIQSQFLINLVRDTLVRTGSRVPEKGQITFNAPFKELYFAYGAISKLSVEVQFDGERKRHIDLLLGVMESLFSRIAKTIPQQLSKGTIEYANLWSLFPPKHVVYRKQGSQDLLLQVVETRPVCREFKKPGDHDKVHESIELGLRITLQAISFDGTNFGTRESQVFVEMFEGEMPVRKLAVYPIRFHLDPQELVRRLAKRGGLMLHYQESKHCEFEGPALFYDKAESLLLNGRVIVDAFHFSKIRPDEWTETEAPEAEMLERYRQKNHSHQGAEPPKLPRLDYDDNQRPSEEMQQQVRRFFVKFYPSLLMFVDPSIDAYSLKHNKWVSLDVSKLKSIEWEDSPLKGLVFDEEKKDIMSTFANYQAKKLFNSNSSIAAKGGGLVILLSGPPGTGKTLTAEAIAEESQLPLYRIRAGELGASPTAIERSLAENLELAIQWRCVVLFDEADIFISARNAKDREASEIVSIFLRQLEYFRGIIFLTTNLPENIDEAFRSRCRLHIQYPNLGKDFRRQVWELNFRQKDLLPSINTPSPYGAMEVFSSNRNTLSLVEAEWSDLLEYRLSGREIHNVVVNVHLWCTERHKIITLEEIKQAISLTVPLAKLEAQLIDDGDYYQHAGGSLNRKRPRLTVPS